MKIKLLFIAVAILSATQSKADFKGTVLSIRDGGSVVVNSNGQDIVVKLNSIATPYPNQNLYAQLKSNHLIISEKPGDYVPQAKDFPSRNRLIAGLSESVVVTEAEKRSGAMITVGYALDQGKDIYCIPSRIGDPMGCNLLIQQGAKLVLTVNDIIED